MKIPTFPNRPPDKILSAKFHLMVGPNMFTDSNVTLNITQQVLTVSGKWGVNKEIKLNMRDLEEVRLGLHTDKWIELSAKAEPLCSSKHVPENVHHFSLVSKSTPNIIPGQTVELISKNAEEFRKWIRALKELVYECQVKENKIRSDQLIMLEHFYEKKIKSSMMISNFKLKNFIEKININIEKENLDEIFKMYGLSSLGSVSLEQFIQLMTHFDTRSGLDFLFYKYSIAHSEFMDAEGLKRFFKTEQSEQKSLFECDQLIRQYSSFDCTSDPYSLYLTRRSFYRLVDSDPSFALFSPNHLSVCQDMDQPMSHYFIATSHNSYLVGNQLTSDSSYEIYRKILIDGCRCIEIDVWDGSSEPEVYHGHTFTSRILLRGILEVIAEAAFKTSDYPVILSIENHLSPPFQRQMAQMMRQILAPYIYLDDVPEKQTYFPSPEVFKNKIFIKGSKSETFIMPDSEATKHSFLCFEWTSPNAPKKKKHTLTSQHSFIRHDFDSDDDDIEDEDENDDEQTDNNTNHQLQRHPNQVPSQRRRLNLNRLRNMAVYRGRSYTLRQAWAAQSYDNNGENENENQKEQLLEDHLSLTNDKHSERDGQTMAKAVDTNFSSVINYFKTKKFSNITDAIKEFKFYEMCSRDENASKRIFSSNPELYRKFTSTNMVRTYPHGLRTNSTNYMPLDHWDVGAQMVALNYQTISVAMLINWAQFALNGRSGYVLKPAFLRTPEKVKLPKQLPKTMLQVTILCGQFWKPFQGKVELKVSTRVYCPDKEQRMDLKKPESTKVVADNGFNPVWNETFLFDLSNPELSFVQFMLVNSKDFVGHHMISFQAMQRGVRHINLFDHDNKLIPFARIYVQIDHWLDGERKT